MAPSNATGGRWSSLAKLNLVRSLASHLTTHVPSSAATLRINPNLGNAGVVEYFAIIQETMCGAVVKCSIEFASVAAACVLGTLGV